MKTARHRWTSPQGREIPNDFGPYCQPQGVRRTAPKLPPKPDRRWRNPYNSPEHELPHPSGTRRRQGASSPGSQLAPDAAADRFYFPAGIAAVVNDRPILDSEVRKKTSRSEELLRRQYPNDAAMLQQKLQEQQQAALEGLVNDELIRIETERVDRRASEEHLDPQVADHRPADLRPLPELRAKTFIRYSGGVAANSVSSQKRVLKIQVKHVGPSSVGDALIRSRLGVKEGAPVSRQAWIRISAACMARGTSTTYG